MDRLARDWMRGEKLGYFSPVLPCFGDASCTVAQPRQDAPSTQLQLGPVSSLQPKGKLVPHGAPGPQPPSPLSGVPSVRPLHGNSRSQVHFWGHPDRCSLTEGEGSSVCAPPPAWASYRRSGLWPCAEMVAALITPRTAGVQPRSRPSPWVVAVRGGRLLSWAVVGRQAPGTTCLAADLQAPPLPHPLASW